MGHVGNEVHWGMGYRGMGHMDNMAHEHKDNGYRGYGGMEYRGYGPHG